MRSPGQPEAWDWRSALMAGSPDPVMSEQLDALWRRAVPSMLSAGSFAIVLAFYLRDSYGAVVLAGWLALKLLPLVVRWMQAARHRQQPVIAPRDRLIRSAAWLAVDGAGWGVAGAAFAGGSEPIAAMVAAALACIACLGTFGLQGSLLLTLAYAVPILAPVSLGLFLRADEFGAVGGIGIALVMVLQVLTAVRSEQRLVETVSLRRRAEALSEEKSEALRMALRHSAVKSQFLGSVSHELRTPLHGILGLARLLHLDADDAVTRHRVELIEGAGRHLQAMMDDLLDLSRMETGQPVLHAAPFDLRALMGHLTEMAGYAAQDRGLRFICELDLPRPCWVHGDATRVRQVLHHLIGSAIKTTPSGEVTLKAHSDPRLPARRLFAIADNGPALDRDAITSLFEPFALTGETITARREGSGLGLHVARELARAMGGDVTVRSAVGRGSTFVFDALLTDAAPVPAPPEATLRERRLGSGRAGPPLVLIVEDDDVNAMIASAVVERCGASTERAHNGREAVLQALRDARRPDLVLMDCRMPVMDGYAATREIREHERQHERGRVPIVALTATVSDLGRAQCLEAGMDDFLAKPFSAEALGVVLESWLGSQMLSEAIEAGDDDAQVGGSAH